MIADADNGYGNALNVQRAAIARDGGRVEVPGDLATFEERGKRYAP